MNDMDFSVKLTDARKAEGLTQEEVAEKCNLNVRTIQRIESRQVQPRPQTVRLIAEALEIDLSEPAVEVENRSFIWHIKDLFNFKTDKMRKLTILSSSALLLFVSIFMISGSMLAQQNKPKPKSGLTITYNPNKSVKRIDAVYTHELTLDSLTNMADKLEKHGVQVKYRSMTFDKNGFLTSIECENKLKGKEVGGSFSAKNLDTSNKNYLFGFYFDNSQDAEDRSCSGACWGKY